MWISVIYVFSTLKSKALIFLVFTMIGIESAVLFVVAVLFIWFFLLPRAYVGPKPSCPGSVQRLDIARLGSIIVELHIFQFFQQLQNKLSV